MIRDTRLPHIEPEVGPNVHINVQVSDGSAKEGSERDSDSAASSESDSDGGADAEGGVPEFVFAGKSVSAAGARPAVRKRPQVSALSPRIVSSWGCRAESPIS